MDTPNAPFLPMQSEEVVQKIWSVIGSRRGFLIGIDGRSGIGKSTYARYLSYRLNMPAYHLDEFMVGKDLHSHSSYFASLIQKRLDAGRPVIAEGLCLVAALAKFQLSPDFLLRLTLPNFIGPEEFDEECQRYESQVFPSLEIISPNPELDDDWFKQASS